MSGGPTNFASKLGVPEYEFRLVFGCTKIDYDPTKDEINRKKHKYALESAVWLLEQMLLPIPTGRHRPHIICDAFRENGEVRHQHMCVDDSGLVVFFVTTMRDDETVRLISMRHADPDERVLFQEKTGYVEKVPQS